MVKQKVKKAKGEPDPKKIRETAFVDNLIKKVPGVKMYKQLIAFNYSGEKMIAKFDRLPTALVRQINEAYTQSAAK
ncbi:MAG TPA: hypothetical protein VK625_01830 [Flavitalea sp.]|jgi:hypothetical protein|nr:hypothetical protein [Flavitalea sp.]